MKQINNIKRKLKWEQYHDPTFDWNTIGFYIDNKLSEDFIREFQDKVDWLCISCSQKLSENFIREFKYKVNWTAIFEYQKVSEEFKEEFKPLLEEFKKEFKKELNIL